jgi:hypothetical protein
VNVLDVTFADRCLFQFGDNTVFIQLCVIAVVTIQLMATTSTDSYQQYPRTAKSSSILQAAAKREPQLGRQFDDVFALLGGTASTS